MEAGLRAADGKSAASGPAAARPVGPWRDAALTVVLLDGNEVQQRHVDDVREAFERDLPGCRLVRELTLIVVLRAVRTCHDRDSIDRALRDAVRLALRARAG